MRSGSFAVATVLALSLCACGSLSEADGSPGRGIDPQAFAGADPYLWLNRLTWGATDSLVESQRTTRYADYVRQQLQPHPDQALPPQVQAQLDAMRITQQSGAALAVALEQQRRQADAIEDEDAKKSARQDYQNALNRLARESATRQVLRALYSPQQVLEQMTWFWMNHFNVYQYKSDIRAMLGDYEEHAVHAHALGKFRDLLGAVAEHPVMLRYLDNDKNTLGHLNENFARELMELHTLGVGAGYTQADVQELARVLTGVGVNLSPDDAPPKLRPERQAYHVRRGVFEFHPARHDFGPKRFLGQPLHAQGLAEFEEALDRLARHPATAHFISRQLAQFWLSDDPPASLVERMSQTFLATGGDIARTLQTLFASPEFTTTSAGGLHKFKDPVRYVLSSVRLAYDRQVILNAGPILNWFNRLGEPLYGHLTPDGYALQSAAWSGPGQMAARIEIAKAIASNSAGLFRAEGAQPQERAAFPQLANALYYGSIAKTLSATTREALAQAGSPQEWGLFLLASPEMMER